MMEHASLFVVILNGQLVISEGIIPSGVALIENGDIVAAGKDFLMALPPDAVLIDAKGGLVGMRSGEGDALGPIRIGASADVACRSPDGKIQWMMQGGEIIYPPGAPTNWAIFWEVQHQNAIRQAMDALEQRQEHIHIQTVAAQDAGVDLVWRFRDGRGEPQEASIRVVPTLIPESQQLLILDQDAARHWPVADVGGARAHWWFYWHKLDDVFYCLPTPALRRWAHAHASTFPLATVPSPADPGTLQGRIIPIGRLRQAIPQLRVLPIPREQGPHNL